MKKSLLDYRATGFSFRRVANTYIISLHGRLALKLSHDSPPEAGKPQKTDSFVAVALSASSVLLYKVTGAFYYLRRICVAALLKEIPVALVTLFSNS